MGLLDKLLQNLNNNSNNNINESIRITKNNDTTSDLYYNVQDTNLLFSSNNDLINTKDINTIRLLKANRGEKYNSFDLMCQDSRVASILDMYADDCTQYNQSSNVIWAESPNLDCANFMNRLINKLELNKYARDHIYQLCKYGNVYLELFYDREYIDRDGDTGTYMRDYGSRLEEHVELVRNPAQMFDLVKKGKTEFYVKVHTNEQQFTGAQMKQIRSYTKLESDIVYPGDKFIHICINSGNNRFPDTFTLCDDDSGSELEYDVKDGDSVLANIFKTWSELNLLEDSVLMNRLSKSAIVRLIQVEVGNTDDNKVRQLLVDLRDRISRSRYFDKNTGEYKNQVNPGPLENIVYHATHNGNGVITSQTIGGDVDVKALADVDYFLAKFAQGFPVPLAYVKMENDDGGGLSAGTSLTKFDARYGKTLKRYQNAYINGITDLLKLFAYKRGMLEYMDDFVIKMVSPSAIEDNERDEKLIAHAGLIRDVMNVFDDQSESYSPKVKKQILNYLVQTMLQDEGLTSILQEDMAREQLEASDDDDDDDNDTNDTPITEITHAPSHHNTHTINDINDEMINSQSVSQSVSQSSTTSTDNSETPTTDTVPEEV